MIGLWIGGLTLGIIVGWAFLRFAYDGPNHGDRGAVDPAYAADNSTMRAVSTQGVADLTSTRSSDLAGSPVVVAASPTALPGRTVTITPTKTPLPPVTMTGSGTLVSETVALSHGLVLLTSTHVGAGRFQVTIFDQAGNQIARVANGTGNWTGAGSAIIPHDAQYLFEVLADGDWTIQAQSMDPDLSASLEIPFEQEGSGSRVVAFVKVQAATYRLSATCDSGTLLIISTSHDGSFRRTLLSTACPFDGTVAFPAPHTPFGFYALDVLSSGTWTVGLE